MIVSTTQYVFAHGREPRGRGSWAFFFDFGALPAVWVHGETYSEAKRQAIVEANRVGASRITVGS